MGYPKYEEDNRKIMQERCNSYRYDEKPPRQEEYIPYTVRYQLSQPTLMPRKKNQVLYIN